MLFVTQHLTRHHFFHAPHKWFLALLISPIHFAEIHYKKKYHLNFKHAKKLFAFDMILLSSIIVLIIATSFWFFYNPNIVDQINLSIHIGLTIHISLTIYISLTLHIKGTILINVTIHIGLTIHTNSQIRIT